MAWILHTAEDDETSANVWVSNVAAGVSNRDIEQAIRDLAAEGNPGAIKALRLVAHWIPQNSDWRESGSRVYRDGAF